MELSYFRMDIHQMVLMLSSTVRYCLYLISMMLYTLCSQIWMHIVYIDITYNFII